MKITKTKLNQIVREELQEGWKDVAMAGGMALGSMLPGQDAVAAAPQVPTTQVQKASDPLLIDDSKWNMHLLVDLFLDPRGGLSITGQKELSSLNQLDSSGRLTDKADLERKNLFKNSQVAPLQLSADDLIGAIMDPRPVALKEHNKIKITKAKLNQIIKEETQNVLKEGLMGGLHSRYYGPDDVSVDAVKLMLSEKGLMKNPIRPGQTVIPIDQDPAFIVSDLPVSALVGIITDLYRNQELTLGFDEDTYKMMDDFFAIGHGGEPRFAGAHMLRQLFSGLNGGLDKKLP